MSTNADELKEMLPMTVDQWKQIATPRCELLHGFEYALRAQSTRRKHGRLVGRITASINQQLIDGCWPDTPVCEAISESALVRINEHTAHIPDVYVDCNVPEDEDPIEVHLVVVFEILSSSTAIYDKTTKVNNYKTVESIQCIVLVDYQACKVESFYRRSHNPAEWNHHTTLIGPESVSELKIQNVPITLDFKQLF